MQYAKISHTNRQISIGVLRLVEDETMSRTVHWLQALLFLSLLEEENVLFVLEVVTASLPELRVVKIRRDNFAIPSNRVLRSHQFYQAIVDDCSMRKKQSASRRHVCESEQMLLNANDSMVSLC